MSDSDEAVFNTFPAPLPRPRRRARVPRAPRRRPTVLGVLGALALAYALTVVVLMAKELKAREPALNGAAALFLSVAYLVPYAMVSVFKWVFGAGVA